MTVLEFGSGKSTLFIASKVGHLESIEHNEKWFTKIKAELNKNNFSNVNYILCKPEFDESKDELEQRHKTKFDGELTHFHIYYNQINNYPENHFDIILIDGRARVECTIRAIPKLKSGGVLILDNSERKRYEPIHEMLNGWQKINTTTGLTNTTLWFRP